MGRTFLIVIAAVVLPAGAMCQTDSSSSPHSAAEAIEAARKVYDQQGPRAALPELERLVTEFEKAGDRRNKAITLGMMSNCYRRFNQFPKALELAERGLTINTVLGDVGQQGRSYNQLGLIYWQMADYPRAKQNLQRAIDLGRQANDRVLEASALNNVGLVEDEQGDYLDSSRQYQEALELDRTTGFKRGESDVLGNLGGDKMLLGRFNEAIPFYQEALKLDEEEGLKPGQSADLGNLAMCYGATGKTAEALATFDRALQLAEEAGLARDQADWHRGKGDALEQSGKYQEALGEYQRAQLVYEKAGLKRELVNTLNGGGNLYILLGDVASGERSFRRAFELASSIHNQQGIILNLLSLGEIERRQSRVADAGAFKNGPTPAAFVAKINPSLSGSGSLIYSALLSEPYNNPLAFFAPAGGNGIAVDANGNAFIAGGAGPGLPLVNPVMEQSEGVYQSTNGGQSWTPLSHGLTDFPIFSVAIDASTSPRTLYVGTGMGSIFASTDGGLNWSKVLQLSDFPNVFSVAVDPTAPTNVYAGTQQGIFKSSDRGSTWTALNAGLSSIATGNSNNGLGGIMALLFDVDRSTGMATLYAGAFDGLYKLTAGANTWIALGGGAVLNISIDTTSSPHTLYIAGGVFSAVGYKSTDGGTTWTSLNPSALQQFSQIVVDTTTRPGTLYACNSFGAINEDSPPLFKSTDGGTTWSGPLGSQFGAPEDFDGFGICPTLVLDNATTPSILYAVTGSYLFRSVDGGNSWSAVALSPGFPGTFQIAVALDLTTGSSTSPSNLFVGTGSVGKDNTFVAELDPSGSTLLFCTYLDGIGEPTSPGGIALDASDNIYVSGVAGSPYFPTVGAYQPEFPAPWTGFAFVPLLPPAGDTPALPAVGFVTKLGSQTLPQSSSSSVSTQLGVQTGTLTVTLPNIFGSTTSSAPTMTVTPLSSTQTANFSLSNNLGAYDVSTTASFSGSVTLCFQALTVNDSFTFSNLRLLHIINGTPVDVTTSRDFNTRTVCGSVTSLSPFVLVSPAPPPITWSNPQNVVYGTLLGSAQLNATAEVPGTFTYTPAPGTVMGPGGGQTLLVIFTPADTLRYTTSTKMVTINVLYSTGSCDGAPGHTILPPINADGSSVFKLGSTVPTKFRVCDVNGNSVGLPGTVASYKLIAAGASGGLTVDEQVYSTSSDTAFHWDPTGQQWVFNQGTGKSNPTLSQSNTIYVFRITLKDGTYIQFQYGLK